MMPKSNINIKGALSFFKESGGYFLSTIINQALPFILLPIITKYLSAAEYGSLALFSFYMAVANSLLGSAVVNIISKHFFSDPKEKVAEIIGSSILIMTILTVFSIIVILTTGTLLTNWLDLETKWLLAVPLASFSFNIFNLGLTVMRNLKKVKHYSYLQISNTVLNLSISLLLIIALLWGWQGRVTGIITANVLSAIIVFWYVKRQGLISLSIKRDMLTYISKTILPLIPNSLQMVFIIQAGIFMMNFFYTKDLTGLYTIALQFALMIRILADTLNLSWSPILYKQLSLKEGINKLYLSRMLLMLASIIFAGVMFINITAGFILELMTSPEYSNADQFVPWLTGGYFFYGLILLIWPILIKHNKQKQIGLVTLASLIFLFSIVIPMKNEFGYIGLAASFTFTFIFMFICFIWQSQKTLPLPFFKALNIFAK